MQSLVPADLERGEGEWRNMQPVLRSAFRQLLETSGKQQAQIQDLCEICLSLRSQLAARPTHDEVREIVEDAQRRARAQAALQGGARGGAPEAHMLSVQLQELRTELQRKASVQYVDDCQRRKLDRSEAIARQLAEGEDKVRALVRACVAEESKDTQRELAAAKKVHERLLGLVQEAVREREQAGAATHRALAALTAQVAQLQQDRAAGEEERRAAVRGLELSVTAKADKAALTVALGAVERALQEHERAIATLRLRPLGGGGGGGGTGQGQAEAEGLWQEEDEAGREWEGEGADQDGEGGLQARLKGSRTTLAVAAAHRLAHAAGREAARARERCGAADQRVAALEAAVAGCAGVAQVEALSVILEEQQLRMEGLVRGTLAIEPVLVERERSEALVAALSAKLCARLDAVAAQLGEAPQGGPSVRAALQQQAQGQAACGARIEAVAAALKTCGSRLAALEASGSKHAKAIVGLDRRQREGEGDVSSAQDKLAADLEAVRRTAQQQHKELQRQLSEQQQELWRQQDKRDRLDDRGNSASPSPYHPPASPGEVEGGLGAAAVDARLAVLLAEKQQLRQQL